MLDGFQDLLAAANVKHAQAIVLTPRRNALTVGGVTHRVNLASMLELADSRFLPIAAAFVGHCVVVGVHQLAPSFLRQNLVREGGGGCRRRRLGTGVGTCGQFNVDGNRRRVL